LGNIDSRQPDSEIMDTSSEQATVEVRIDWENDGIRHRNRDYFEKISFWRDIFPGALSLKLPESDGGWVSENFTAGELVPQWSKSNLQTVKLNKLKLQRKHGPSIKIHRGRHYPRYIAAGTAGIFDGDMQPLRITALDEHSATIDLNHPLSRSPITVAARIVNDLGAGLERGGRCTDVVMDALNAGIGLETLHPPGETDFLSDSSFNRMDERKDSRFYETPRLVQHLDHTAIEQVSAIYQRFLQPGMQVLDLMSSWVSHIPESVSDLNVTGLGMNADELAENPQLASHVIQDINLQTALPFGDQQFDAVICTASVEYLTNPAAVFRELGRVLKPGAPAIMTFSDRWFPTKVIEQWTELHPFERLALVQEYFRSAGNFTGIETETARGRPRPEDDKYAGQQAFSDPVYAAWARTNGQG
jgi:ubiquinone/menaquinone biosynthesis C-methylase UbiE